MSGGSMSQSTVVNSPNRKQPIRVTPTTPPRNESLCKRFLYHKSN